MLRKGRDYANDYRFTCPVCKGKKVLKREKVKRYKDSVPFIQVTRCSICLKNGEVEEVPHKGK